MPKVPVPIGAPSQSIRGKEVPMWYVVQVIGGQEDAAVLKIQKQASNETFKTVFVPKYEIRKRYSGAWKTRREVLFPGYVFVDTKTPDSFRQELNKVTTMTKLLSGETETGKKKFIPLSNEEKTLISAFVGDEDHVMKMSEGIIEGDQIRVLKGPLQGYEALVAKVDRHKRLAYIDLNILGRIKTVKVGLEIVQKR